MGDAGGGLSWLSVSELSEACGGDHEKLQARIGSRASDVFLLLNITPLPAFDPTRRAPPPRPKVPGSVRVVLLRTGIVLARDGGVLGKMLPIFQLFAGGPLGSGKQWMSWIHREDLVDLM